MNADAKKCDAARIERFLRRELSDKEMGEFVRHLDGCPICSGQLESKAVDESWWRRASEFLPDCPFDLESLSGRPIGAEGPSTNLMVQQVLDHLAPTDNPQMLGRIGTYEVAGVVGSGGMGVVLKAFDPTLDRYVAIKTLSPTLASSGSARKRFSREARAAAAVVQDNVIEIYGVAEAGTLPYLVMPYVRGTSLQRRLDDFGPLAPAEVLRIGMQTAAGLAAAHSQGLVHRDIKPANILLSEGVERVLITDFGLARAADDASLTKTGVITGTPQYMSPEQARGEAVDQRSDLFSLGSVMYAMCTGRPPFRAEGSYAVLRRITDNEPRPICEINPEIPEWLATIIEKLLAKHPEERFVSASEVATLLKQCLAHVQHPTVEPLPKVVRGLAEPSSPSEGGGKFGLLTRLALVAAGVMAIAGVFYLATMDPQGATPDAARFASLNTGVGENWHRFRGPGGSGVSTHDNIPTAWNATSGDGIAWKTRVPLPGKNSPIVWEDRVFVSGANQTKQQVYCFDANSGELLWEKDVPTKRDSSSDRTEVLEDTGYAAPSLVTDGKRVFAVFASGDIAAIPLSGNGMWIRHLGTLDNVYGHASSPVVYRNLLLIQLDQGTSAKKQKSKLLALDVESGETVYEKRRPVANSWASPILINADGEDQLVTCGVPWTIAYDPNDGKEIWRANCLKGDVGPSPVFADGTVYVASDFSQCAAIRIGGEGDVTESHVCWTADSGLPDTSSPLVADGRLFFLASWGALTCYDSTNGELLWEHDLDGSFTASPSWADGRVYVIGEDGKGWILAPDHHGSTVIAETDLGEKCFASPAFQDGRIYIRGSEHLVCIGEGRKPLSFGPGLSGKPTAGDPIPGSGTPSDCEGKWPGFRGANRDGISVDGTKLARSWPPEGPAVLWSVGLADGYAGASVDHGRVYVLDYDQRRGADTMRCFSMNDGHEIWRNGYPVLVKPNHGITRTVPAVVDHRVVSMGPHCHLACWDAETGECHWLIDLVREHDTTVPSWYAGQCPLIDQGKLIVATCGRALLIAIDYKTGKVTWESKNPHGWTATHGSVVPMDSEGERSYVYGASGGIVGVAAADGSILWEYTDWQEQFANCPSPVVLPGGRIFLSSGYRADVGSLMLQLREFGGRTVAEALFELSPRQFNSAIQTPVFLDGHIYGVHRRGRGRMVCLDVTGRGVWDSGDDRFGQGPYLFADGLLLALREDGMLTLAEASSAGYRRLDQHPVFPNGRSAWGPMAIAGGRLILRDLNRMVCVDLREK